MSDDNQQREQNAEGNARPHRYLIVSPPLPPNARNIIFRSGAENLFFPQRTHLTVSEEFESIEAQAKALALSQGNRSSIYHSVVNEDDVIVEDVTDSEDNMEHPVLDQSTDEVFGNSANSDKDESRPDMEVSFGMSGGDHSTPMNTNNTTVSDDNGDIVVTPGNRNNRHNTIVRLFASRPIAGQKSLLSELSLMKKTVEWSFSGFEIQNPLSSEALLWPSEIQLGNFLSRNLIQFCKKEYDEGEQYLGTVFTLGNNKEELKKIFNKTQHGILTKIISTRLAEEGQENVDLRHWGQEFMTKFMEPSKANGMYSETFLQENKPLLTIQFLVDVLVESGAKTQSYAREMKAKHIHADDMMGALAVRVCNIVNAAAARSDDPGKENLYELRDGDDDTDYAACWKALIALRINISNKLRDEKYQVNMISTSYQKIKGECTRIEGELVKVNTKVSLLELKKLRKNVNDCADTVADIVNRIHALSEQCNNPGTEDMTRLFYMGFASVSTFGDLIEIALSPAGPEMIFISQAPTAETCSDLSNLYKMVQMLKDAVEKLINEAGEVEPAKLPKRKERNFRRGAGLDSPYEPRLGPRGGMAGIFSREQTERIENVLGRTERVQPHPGRGRVTSGPRPPTEDHSESPDLRQPDQGGGGLRANGGMTSSNSTPSSTSTGEAKMSATEKMERFLNTANKTIRKCEDLNERTKLEAPVVRSYYDDLKKIKGKIQDHSEVSNLPERMENSADNMIDDLNSMMGRLNVKVDSLNKAETQSKEDEKRKFTQYQKSLSTVKIFPISKQHHYLHFRDSIEMVAGSTGMPDNSVALIQSINNTRNVGMDTRLSTGQTGV